MKTLEDTLNTMTIGARSFAKSAMETADRIFNESGGAGCVILVVPMDNSDIRVFEMTMCDELRPIIWATLRLMRQTYQITGFVSEVWMLNYKGKDKTTWERPSQSKDSSEHVMFNVWEGLRTITFLSDIKRDPSRMEPWRVFWDSYFPEKGMSSIGGAMMDGPHSSNVDN